MEKDVFGSAKKANMAIFVARPQVSLAISQGSMHKIPTEDMSLMCLLYVTIFKSLTAGEFIISLSKRGI